MSDPSQPAHQRSPRALPSSRSGAAPCLSRVLVDEIVLETETEIERAVSLMIVIEKTVAEGAAAVLAALLAKPERFRGRRTCLLVSGGEIDQRLLACVLMRGLMRYGGSARRCVICRANSPAWRRKSPRRAPTSSTLRLRSQRLSRSVSDYSAPNNSMHGPVRKSAVRRMEIPPVWWSGLPRQDAIRRLGTEYRARKQERLMVSWLSRVRDGRDLFSRTPGQSLTMGSVAVAVLFFSLVGSSVNAFAYVVDCETALEECLNNAGFDGAAIDACQVAYIACLETLGDQYVIFPDGTDAANCVSATFPCPGPEPY
jgi:hypothetical protein